MKHLSLRFWLLVLLLVALTMPMAVVSAQGPEPGDKVIFGNNYTLASGETLAGSLLVLGGSTTLAENSTVTGDVTVLGGSVTVRGLVEGSVSVLGGSLRLESTAVVEGDVTSIGGSLERDPGAEIQGENISGFKFDFGDLGRAPRIDITPPPPANDGFAGWLLYTFMRGFSAVALAALMAMLGILLVVLAPQATNRVVETAHDNAGVSFGVGCLSQVLAIPVIVLLSITLCLIPLALIVLLALIVGWVFGWLALGWLIGRRLVKGLRSSNAIDRNSAILEIGVGVVALTLAWQLPTLVPCVGWVLASLIGIVAGSIGLGAVLLTRFGTRPYTPGGGRGGYDAPILPPPPAPVQPTYGAPLDALPSTSLGTSPEPEPPHPSPH
ncbi:MAG: polymer-forming cytoskeletal protein [Caldilineales bacterium]|nr:polymer-forming cytoskeletal protein [Caldilineales bacterium]MCW5860765.1 polymer-forming cytoskeletal protein [Caldilineales bacterium]